MHPGDHPVGLATAQALLADQFLYWAGLALDPVAGGGSDNLLFRLGADMVLRFPRTEWGAGMPGKEDLWLPRLAPHLPLPVPVPLALGHPGQSYPFHWSVTRWLPGRDAGAAPPDQAAAAQDLAGFLRALQAVPVPEDAPTRPPEPEDDPFARQMIAAFRPDEGDPLRLAALLDQALSLPRHSGPPVWGHADLHPLNLLTDGRRITGVIDWGAVAAGDPALDLAAGWYLFDAPARAIFRAALAPDPAAWVRGRALAFRKAVKAIPYYRQSNPTLRAVMAATLRRVLEDAG